MIELKAPSDLLVLLRPEIYDVPNAQIWLSFEHKDIRDESRLAYAFKFDGKVFANSDRPAKLGQLPQYVEVFADASVFSSCRTEFIPHCLNLGFRLAEKDSIVLKLMAPIDGRHYEVLKASPSGVTLIPEPFGGWNLLTREKIDMIRGLCPE